MTDPQTKGPAPVLADRGQRREFFTRIALAGSSELRTHLPITEDHYRFLALEAQADARAYFTYSVLDSVYEAGVAMLRWEDLLSDDDTDKSGRARDIGTRLVKESVEAEGALWTRRLMEALTTLINFSTTNDETFYRHWLFLDQFEAMAYGRKDLRDYFECDNRGLARRINETIATIRTLEPSIDLRRCWYLKDRRPLPTNPRPPVLASFAENLRTAMQIAKPRERAELGLSYHHFSRVSGSMHFSPSRTRYDSSESLSDHFTHCALLAQSILLRVIELHSMKPTGLCAQMVSVYDSNTFPDEGAQRLTKDRAKVGDFVVVRASLARVTAVKDSAYGYNSYTVKYLQDPPQADIPEDDVLPFHVRRLVEAERLKQDLLKVLKSAGSDKAVTDAERLKNVEAALDASVQEAWNLGLKEHFLGLAPLGKPAGASGSK